MADNYCLFSELVPALSRQERAWVKRLLSVSGEDRAAEFAAAGIDIDPEEDDWPGFQWELLSSRPCALWLYARESGNLNHITQLVKAFLHRFRPDQCWTMTWAETCSRPRVGDFGGGGAFVTSGGVEFYNAHAWVSKRSAAFVAKARRTARRA